MKLADGGFTDAAGSAGNDDNLIFESHGNLSVTALHAGCESKRFETMPPSIYYVFCRNASLT
jgi:hypothetical protein